MKLFCLEYPSDFADSESHNRLMENIGDLRWRQVADGVFFIFSDLDEADLAAKLFEDIPAMYAAMLFSLGEAVPRP